MDVFDAPLARAFELSPAPPAPPGRRADARHSPSPRSREPAVQRISARPGRTRRLDDDAISSPRAGALRDRVHRARPPQAEPASLVAHGRAVPFPPSANPRTAARARDGDPSHRGP